MATECTVKDLSQDQMSELGFSPVDDATYQEGRKYTYVDGELYLTTQVHKALKIINSI